MGEVVEKTLKRDAPACLLIEYSVISGLASKTSSAGKAGEAIIKTRLAGMETVVHEKAKMTTENAGEVEEKVAWVATRTELQVKTDLTALVARRTYLSFLLVVSCSRNASFCLVVHHSVVVLKVTSDAISIIGAVSTIIWTFVATEGFHVHQISLLALTLTGTFETEVEAMSTN